MRVIRQLRRVLSGFLEGRARGLLVVHTAREQLGHIYMTLAELERGSTDVHLSFPHAFVSAEDYVGIVAARVLASAREARGAPTLALPASCHGPERSPIERLISILAYARDLLPYGGDAPRLVCTLCPLTGDAEREYLAFVHTLVETERGLPPWFHRMRIVLSVPQALTPPLRCGAFIQHLHVDLSSAALEAGATADADDPELPAHERAASLLQSATMLLGRQRLDAAASSYRDLLERAQAVNDPVLTAMALIGLGEVASARHEREEAIAWLERALEPAGHSKAPVILLTITSKLARLYVDMERLEEAEAFFDGAQQLASVLPEPETQASELEWRGRVQELRGAPQRATLSYLQAATIARDNERSALLERVCARLRRSPRQGLTAEQRAERAALLDRSSAP